MRTREIPAGQWAAYFESFSRRHSRNPVNLSTVAPALGAQYNARDIPLVGVAAEAAAGDDGGQIQIMLGEPPGAHLLHTVARPSRVRVTEWNDGYSATVQIDSESEGQTLLHVGFEAEALEPGVVTDEVELGGG